MVFGRLLLGWGAICWGLFLFWPGALFPTEAQIASGTGRTTYAVMAQLAPELLWAACFMLHGTFLIVSVYFKVPPTAAIIDAFNGAVLWISATAACFMAHFHGWASYHPPAAMGSDFVMAVGSFWWFLRVCADRDYEAKH